MLIRQSFQVMNLLNIKDKAAVFNDIQLMESKTLELIHKNRTKAEPPCSRRL